MATRTKRQGFWTRLQFRMGFSIQIKGGCGRHCTNEDGEIRRNRLWPSHFFWATGARAGGSCFRGASPLPAPAFLTTFFLFSSEAFLKETPAQLALRLPEDCPMEQGRATPGVVGRPNPPGSFMTFPGGGSWGLTSRASPTGGVASESVPEDGGRASAKGFRRGGESAGRSFPQVRRLRSCSSPLPGVPFPLW